MISWINKHFSHSRDDEGDFGIRVLMHIPIGMLLGIPILGWGLIWLFREYENSEDKWVHDEAWKDYYGAIVGCCLTIIGIIVALSIVWLRYL